MPIFFLDININMVCLCLSKVAEWLFASSWVRKSSGLARPLATNVGIREASLRLSGGRLGLGFLGFFGGFRVQGLGL